MYDKRMLIVPASLAKKIDANRGDMSQLEFIDFLIESHLQGSEAREAKGAADKPYVTREELQAFEQGIKALLRSFLEFFISYGLELGKQPAKERFNELDQKLQGFGGSFSVRHQADGER